MSKRRTALDKAIERIDNQIRVLNAARVVLVEQQGDAHPHPAVFREPEPERRRRPRAATVALEDAMERKS